MNRDEIVLSAALRVGLTFELPPTKLFEFAELIAAADAAELRRLHAENESDTALLRQALEALEYEAQRGNDDAYRSLRDALSERLGEKK